jgi:hypothetical protein
LLLLASACTVGTYSGTPGDSIVTDGGNNLGSDGGIADLPCDVATLLSNDCISCHGSPPSGGAPMALNSLAALKAPSLSQPSQSNAQLSIVRMQSATSPMPPSPAPRVSAADIASFAAWVDAGTPAGTCGTTGDPAFTAPPQCSSNSYWTNGDTRSPLMHPGKACIACHAGREEAPTFAIAGTVYPTGHEPDDCNSTGASGAVITVTDSTGAAHALTPNAAGNFYELASGGWPVFPITAQVNFRGKTRAMQGAVSSGDCNSCHTQSGSSGAPGRIALP